MAFGGAGLGAGMGGGGNPGGLPFGGIPSEMQRRVEEILEEEPAWPAASVTFSHRSPRTGVNLRRLLRPHRKLFFISLGLVVIEALSIQAAPLLSAIGIDQGILAGDWGVVLAVAGAALAAVLISIVASGLRLGLTGRIAARVMFDLRQEVFAHLQRLSLDYYTREKGGVILTRMTSDIEALQLLFQEGLVQFGVQALTMVIVTVALLALNVDLALITLVLIVPALTLLSLWFRASSDEGYARVRDGLAAVLTDVSESLQGVRVVAAFNRQRHNVLNHRNIVGEYRDRSDQTGQTLALFSGSTEFVGIMGQAMLLMIGSAMLRSGDLTLGELTAFILYLNSMFQPIQQLVQQYSLYQQGQAAIVKLNDLLATAPTVEEAPDASPLPPLEGAIEFAGVSFAYDAETPVLRDVNLRIAAGETIALVGPTGGGKSTIAKLITRFYDPTEGAIRVDGHDLRDATLASLRGQLGVVPQEPYLFAGTVRDNIAFARPSASDADVMDAVRNVGLGELVARLPAGIHTPVHERGISLSSGERQLIALARAFLAGPRVLVLDEATSSLDLRSERMVEAALDTLLQGRTAVIVAHRLTTAMRADRIAVVERGRIVELGSHEALLARGGRYATMHDAWVQHLEHDRAPEPGRGAGPQPGISGLADRASTAAG